MALAVVATVLVVGLAAAAGPAGIGALGGAVARALGPRAVGSLGGTLAGGLAGAAAGARSPRCRRLQLRVNGRSGAGHAADIRRSDSM